MAAMFIGYSVCAQEPVLVPTLEISFDQMQPFPTPLTINETSSPFCKCY